MTTSWAPTPFMRSKRPSPEGSRSPSIRSAGNLFGTTRKDQPAEFAGSPGARPARISGGVLSSLPAQNTQLGVRGFTGSGVKSDGRRARSVEMITQRPTTGSLRSSGTQASHGRVLARGRPPEERAQRFRRRLALEEHGSHLGADGQAHGVAAREREGRAHGGHTFRDHAGRRGHGERRLPARERDAEGAI